MAMTWGDMTVCVHTSNLHELANAPDNVLPSFLVPAYASIISSLEKQGKVKEHCCQKGVFNFRI